ncbi:hypothetical protein pdam_00019197 [Pocillopora damicornis]|uniref:Negative elongation factor E n=1 Tax=Pocillopora damicornis TaxID=46731 RepID=A0A3M6TIN8_POCDA|nr:hypothetical protein pdam_00019197 [Pocillopora damicornis]
MGLPNLTAEEEYLLRKKRHCKSLKKKSKIPAVSSRVRSVDFLQQPASNRNEQQARAEAIRNLYHESFIPSSTSQNKRFSGGQGSGRRSWSDDQSRKGNTIYVNGYGLTEKILQEEFTKFGKVQHVNFEREKSQGFVTLDSCEAAEKAVDEMNGMMVSGVHIKVAFSRRQPNMGDTQGYRRPGLGSRDSRGHSSGLQSREAREIVSYDDL